MTLQWKYIEINRIQVIIYHQAIHAISCDEMRNPNWN